MVVWGAGSEAAVIPALDGIVGIAVSAGQVVALEADGGVALWSPGDEEPSRSDHVRHARSLAVGGRSGRVLLAAGREAAVSQLDLCPCDDASRGAVEIAAGSPPTQESGRRETLAVAATSDHGLVLLDDSSVWSWALESPTRGTSARRIDGLPAAADLAATAHYAAIIEESRGDVFVWRVDDGDAQPARLSLNQGARRRAHRRNDPLALYCGAAHRRFPRTLVSLA